MKTQRDKDNEKLSVIAVILLAATVGFVLLLSTAINLSLNEVEKQANAENSHVEHTK